MLTIASIQAGKKDVAVMMTSSNTTNTCERVGRRQQPYDIIFIGAGIATSYSVLSLISLLEKRPPSEPLRVAVVDKSAEFWVGVPYGIRSGDRSLIITSIREFLPESERTNFVAWLRQNWENLSQERGPLGESTERWYQSNQAAIAAGAWDDIFVPRFTFGRYLTERVGSQLAYAQDARLLSCECITGEVKELSREGNRFTVGVMALSSEPTESLTAGKVVLALGSPPNKTVSRFRSALSVSDNFCYIEDMYEPSHEANLQRMADSLRFASPSALSDILVIGSNASSLEAIYTILDRQDLSDRISKVIVLSPSGEFPHRINPAESRIEFKPQYLAELVSGTNLVASDILNAVERDVAAAREQGIPVADTFSVISTGVIAALNRLSWKEQKKFVAKYGVEIGKLQRRAGMDYLNAVDILTSQGRFEFVKGSFVRCISNPQGETEVEFRDSNGNPAILRRPIRAILNCTGFQDVANSSSSLIQSLIANHLAVPTEANRGFQVNEQFEVSDNCHLIGPLIAGNCNQAFRIWHAESCERIIGLSKQLAEVLVPRM